ncbi:MAG: RNA polymerase subunit sigma, partial [Eubacteriales bacterium]|nr:RNA polymerase subunit sigma [Eubacteriales bacterium]
MGIDEQICRWQLNKDSEEADRLIQAYLPFIIKTLSKAAGRFIDPAQDDEYSIGLQAFYEAMQR